MTNAVDLIRIPLSPLGGIRSNIIKEKIVERNADGWRLLGPLTYADFDEEPYVILTWVSNVLREERG